VDEWQRSLIYQVYVRSFLDGNGDGVGDLAGVAASFDYLTELGVTALWLSPIHPSPDADFGYDVTDYTAVDPRLGSLASMEELVALAHGRGIAVLLDWVVNHTSSRHPWFADALTSPESEHRDWYVFRPGRGPGQPPTNWRSMFGGSAWTYDRRSQQWYLHTFLPEQPDLNWRNPAVHSAIVDAMRFWLERGIDGFRLDSLPLFVKDDLLRDNPANQRWRPGEPDYWRLRPTHTVDQPEMLDVTRTLRGVVDEYQGRVLLGEMGLPPSRLARYHADIRIPLNFGLITEPWTADRLCARISAYLTALPPSAFPNWVLGNHDVSRVASRLGPGKARAAAVILLTLPGAITIYNGEELGLTDHPVSPVETRDPLGKTDLGRSRDPQRTPMPWNDQSNGGFSPVAPWLPVHPDHARLSVAAQRQDPTSMLTLYRKLIRLRREAPVIALGQVDDLRSDNGVLSYRRGSYHVFANLAEGPTTVPRPTPGRLILSTHASVADVDESDGLHLGPGQAVILDCSG
jgi:alpha-glucosidase